MILDYESSSPAPLYRRIIPILLLFALGVALWLTAGRGIRYWHRDLPMLAVPFAALALCLVPTVSRGINELIDFLQDPSQRGRRITALVLFFASAVYLVVAAYLQERYMGPSWQDEFSYLIQMRMLAQGKLWLPMHPAGESFEAGGMITDRVYASMYFPGTAMLYVPTVWLALPTWLMPVLAAAGCVALFYRVTAELIDGLWGLLAAALLVSLGIFRTLSIMILAQVPILLLGLLMVYFYLRWRKTRAYGWAVAIGLAAGWMAITRPLDAICFCIPVGIAMLLDLRREQVSRRIVTIALGVAAMVPFLGLQLVFNRGVTGNWLQTPWDYYARRAHPQARLGFRAYDPAIRPASTREQTQLAYDMQYVPALSDHQLHRVPGVWWNRKLPSLLRHTVPQGVLLMLLPLSVLSMQRRRWLLTATVPCFIGLYVLYALFAPHYCLTAAPGVIVLVLLGAKTLTDAFQSRRLRAAAPSMVVILCLASLPGLSRQVRDQYFTPVRLKSIDQAIATLPRKPAVVLVRWQSNGNMDEEVVFNADVAWPDDAAVVRAQDLSAEQNRRLIAHYAARQPGRMFYRFEPVSGELVELGRADTLAAAASTRPIDSPARR
jgi:hypothetical protein